MESIAHAAPPQTKSQPTVDEVEGRIARLDRELGSYRDWEEVPDELAKSYVSLRTLALAREEDRLLDESDTRVIPAQKEGTGDGP